MPYPKATLVSACSACVALLASCGGAQPEPAAVVVLPPAAPTPDSPAPESSPAPERTARAAKAPPLPPPRSADTVGDRPAPSQSPAAAQAEVLFNEGRSLMAAGNVPQACAKFEASNHLDPAMGTVLNLAVCEEQIGHVPRACSLFHEAARMAQGGGQLARAQLAADRAAKLGCPVAAGP